MKYSVPSISVITIVKNNEKLLPRAVNSVLIQCFPDFEHIIVNDGSTDATMEIIEKYAEKHQCVKPLHMTQNVGRARARNTGMEAARGRYIFFLDSDDYLPETALTNLYEVAEKEEADIVFGRIKAFDQATGTWLPHYYTDRIIDTEKHNFSLDDHLELVDNHQIVGRLFRKKFLRSNDIKFSTTRRNAEDVLFSFFNVFYAKRLSMVPQKVVYFYNFGNQLETANENKIFDARDNVLETVQFALKYGSNPLKKRMLRKGAMFAGDLFREQKVYQEDADKFKKYLTTLFPLVESVTDDVMERLPPYQQKFARALRSYDFEKAYYYWNQRYGEYLNRLAIKKLRYANEKLANQLDALYASNSWRITAPLRIAMKLYKK